MPLDWETVFAAALQARERAYAPYSGFRVGAAFKVAGTDSPIAGCNVENASFGATICAERNALFQKIALFGKEPSFEYLILLADTVGPVVPCAQCLQVLAEFCPQEFTLYLGNLEGILEKTTLRDLLPRPFTEFKA